MATKPADVIDFTYKKGRATMGTVMAAARFYKNFYAYFANHHCDQEFVNEVMFVMCDPQCHPPHNREQLTAYLNLTL